MRTLVEDYDIVVVGAGHAGCEAALAGARLGLNTVMFTVSVDSIALMPCNPNVGGSSKGHLVRELDALGGEMGKNIDKTFIQSKMLNCSKGPAVHSLRAQADKQAYSNEMRKTLENTPNLTIKQGEVTKLLVEDGKITGVKTYSGATYNCKAVVLCTGTYLKARCIYGDVSNYTGPNGLQAANYLTDSLKELGIEMFRFKTGTPARIAGNTLTGTMTAEYTIVPQNVGKFKIPAQEFTYFDLAKKQYVTLTAAGYELEVAKGSGTTAYTDQHDIEAKNTDILHIKTGDKSLSKDHTPLISRWWYWALFAGLLIISIAGVAVARHQMRLDADVVGRRTSRANKVAKKRLRSAELFMKKHQSEQFYQEVLRALWGYLSDKLNIPVSQLTRQNIVDNLAHRGVSDEICNEIVVILDECEMARYTPDSSLDSNVEAIYDKAVQAINALDKSKLSPR